jgi:hypothetical protein
MRSYRGYEVRDQLQRRGHRRVGRGVSVRESRCEHEMLDVVISFSSQLLFIVTP